MDLAYLISLILPFWLKRIVKPLISPILNRKQQKRIKIKAFSFFSSFIQPKDLIFDIGAHVGTLTDVFLKLNAKVVCIEPQPKIAAFIKNKYLLNKDAVVVEKGLGEREEILPFFINTLTPTLSTFSKKWTVQKNSPKQLWSREIPVQVTTLDNLILEYGQPKFCKIDTEGFESNVLKGLTQKISFLSFEFHNALTEERNFCLDRLSFLGTYIFNYSQTETYQLKLTEWVDKETLKRETNKEGANFWGDIYAKLA